MQFLIKLSLQCGRADWQQFLHEMTPLELDYIIALNSIEPVIREDREDMRVSFMTALLLSCWGSGIDPEDLDYLKFYGKCAEDDDEVTVQSSQANVFRAFGAMPLRTG